METKLVSNKKIIALHIFFIILAGLIAYGNSLKGEFIWDDIFLVKDNVYIKYWANLPKIFYSDIGTGASTEYSFYRPFQILSYMLDYHFWKLNVKGYHITSTLLHILASMCIYWLITILFKDKRLSFFTTLLFIVHPIHTEAVSYISGRADLLAAIFIILSLIFYIKSLLKKNAKLYIVMLATYISAILSKELSLIFPILLLVYHYVFRVKIKINYFLPVVVISAIYILLRLTVLNFFLFNDSINFSVLQRIPGIFVALMNYILLLLFPFNLHMEYGKELFYISQPGAISGIAIFIVLLFAAFKARNRNKIFFFGISWFFAALLLQSNFYLLNAYMAEHWLYLPSIGFFLIISNGLCWLDKKNLSLGILVVLVTFFSSLTIKQNKYWSETSIFYERTFRYAPDSPAVLIGLGNAYKERGRTEEATNLYKKIIEIHPENAEAYLNLGNIIMERGNTDQAISLYKKSIELNSNYIQAYNNLASLYRSIGRNEDAVTLCYQAIKINSEYPEIYFNLGLALAALNKKEEAITAFEKNIKINPNNQNAYNELALIYARNGDYLEAARMYHYIIQSDSKNAQAYNNLGNIYKEINRIEEAISFYKSAIKINPRYAHAYNNLGLIYTLIGNKRDAETAFLKAVELEPSLAGAHNNLAVIYFYQKKYELAVMHCDRAIARGYKVNPDFLKAIDSVRDSNNG